MRVLLDNEFVRVESLEDRRVVVLRRKARSAAVADIPAIYAQPFDHVTAEHRSWGLVIDVRAVAGNNDPAFEQAMLPVRQRASAAFERVIVLVRSMAGRLQIQRTARSDGARVVATADEEEALALAEGRDDASFW